MKATSPSWKEPKITKLTLKSLPINAGNDGSDNITLVIVDDNSFERLIGKDQHGVIFFGADFAVEELKGLFGQIPLHPKNAFYS